MVANMYTWCSTESLLASLTMASSRVVSSDLVIPFASGKLWKALLCFVNSS